MRRQGAEKLVEFLEHQWHGCEAHGLWPDLCYDQVDDHGSSFEEFGDDGVVVVEDGSA